MNKKKSPLILIFVVVFVDLLGFGILIPILPTFATKELHVNETLIGISIAIYSMVQFLVNPFFGSLSDKKGRRSIILYCLLLNAAGYVIFAFTHTYWMLLLSRVVAGIGGSSIGVAQAYIADITTREERAKGMGLIGLAFGLGFVFGPLIGGFLAKYSYMATGFASASTSLIAFIFCYFKLPESLKPGLFNIQEKRKLFNTEAFIATFKHPSVGIAIILFFILTFSVANIYGTFALLGYKMYHLNDMQIGSVYGVIGIIGAIVQGGLIGRLSKKHSDNKLITTGAFFMMIGLALMPYAGSYVGLLIVCVVLASGSGILQPTLLSLLSKVAPEAEQGMILSINQSLSAFARMLGPLWGGFAFEFLGYDVPFETGAACSLLILLFSIFSFNKYIRKEEPVKV